MQLIWLPLSFPPTTVNTSGGVCFNRVMTLGSEQRCVFVTCQFWKSGHLQRIILHLRRSKKWRKREGRESFPDRWRDFTLEIWWYAVHLQRDSLNSFKGCLWRQKHWWQLTFITSLKPFQIAVWNSGFASFPCRTCTHANFRKIFESLQSGEFHAG